MNCTHTSGTRTTCSTLLYHQWYAYILQYPRVPPVVHVHPGSVNDTHYQLSNKNHQHLTIDQRCFTNSGTGTPIPLWWSCNDGRGSYLRTLWPHTTAGSLLDQRTCRSWWTFLPFPNTWQSESSSLGHRWWWHTWGKETHREYSSLIKVSETRI